jgi:hypothetical protein
MLAQLIESIPGGFLVAGIQYRNATITFHVPASEIHRLLHSRT